MGLLYRAVGVDSATTETAGTLNQSVQRQLLTYRGGTPLHGLIFEAPAGKENALKEQIAHITAFFGLVVFLPPRRSLLLFAKSLDPELISYRLFQSIKIPPLETFEADSLDKVLLRLQKSL